jgi:hypothetical protein
LQECYPAFSFFQNPDLCRKWGNELFTSIASLLINLLIAGGENKIAINPVFDKLITSLRTAVDADGTLDKESTSYNHIFDAFRLALKFYRYEEKEN